MRLTDIKSLGKIEIHSASLASTSFALAQALPSFSESFIIVTPTPEAALRVYEDIRIFLKLLGHTSEISKVELFPGWEHSPYRSFQPSIRNKLRRIRVLHRIQYSELRVVVTDIASASQRCPSLQLLKEASLILKVGDIIERNELLSKLLRAGYTQNDPVEDPGQYTVRGNLIDVFSPAVRKPIRIEFFDELVETIRRFDPTSQRSDQEPLSELPILPVTEWPVCTESISNAKSNIKQVCDNFDIPKQARDELFESLDLGIHDPSFDYLLPYFLSQSPTWLGQVVKEMQNQKWALVTIDELTVESTYDNLISSLKEDFQKALASGRIVAHWEQLYIPPEVFKKELTSAAKFAFNSLAVGTSSIEYKITRNDDITPLAGRPSVFELLSDLNKNWRDQGFLRFIAASSIAQVERTRFILEQKSIPAVVVKSIDWSNKDKLQIIEASLSQGFRITDEKIAIITDAEIFGPKRSRARTKSVSSDVSMFVSTLEELNTDDLVVHKAHGVGRYRGLMKLAIDTIPQDFLLIEYAGADRLYLPVYRLDQVQRYVGSPESVALDKLGSQSFVKTKQKVKSELMGLANRLLELYANRSVRKGFSFSEPSELYREFEARFPYAETDDQLKAIDAVTTDMHSDRIMDRLICGDVGYGKTEVAMRAAFLAIQDGKQVAILVPTTVLALQHERSFKERFLDTPISIAVLSRFKTTKEIKATLETIQNGKVDIVIGTHRLLSKDVRFKDLGLIIVDEEQRFGVEHKERLKALKVSTDVLTLTATPIPRTLHMSLMGIRDISIINTPPVDRLSIRTYVARFDEEAISGAIRSEISRGGQVYFIHNRVSSIHAMADRLQAIVPEAKIVVGHGQLDDRTLEDRMLEFYSKKANVLVCSTIIESGLDIPSANTMLINCADTFGLSQLYQLRGRVGRSQMRAYCYLLLPEQGTITDEARNRLEVIQRFADLGSGFRIASHDLELRGGGDLLGKSQSGHISAVGFELYMELLDETIRELKGLSVEDRFDPEIKVPAPALLPEDYVPDVHQRITLYKRLSQAPHVAGGRDSLHDLELELKDRYGKPPTEVENLFWLIRMKQLMVDYRLKTLIAGPSKVSIDASEAKRLSPEKMISLVRKEPSRYGTTPDSKILLKSNFQSMQQLFHDVQHFVSQVAEQETPC